jgi:hypothetical protein
MFPIGDFVASCKQLDEAGFCRQNPASVLLHARAVRELEPALDLSKQTIDRFVLDAADPAEAATRHKTPTREQKAIDPERMYSVFVARARKGSSTSLSIGCSPGCDVQINDQSVSNVHALLERQGRGHGLQDNDSTTGTQLNETLLQSGETRELRSGDVITLGYVELTYLSPADFYQLVRRLFID